MSPAPHSATRLRETSGEWWTSNRTVPFWIGARPVFVTVPRMVRVLVGSTTVGDSEVNVMAIVEVVFGPVPLVVVTRGGVVDGAGMVGVPRWPRWRRWCRRRA